jgi:glycerol-3-phosphate O-acyltransferase/dihydroxyacetone phosphate acyltransferase
MQRLVAAWRVIVGVWTPKRRERPIDSLKSFLPESATPVGATPHGSVEAWQKGGMPVKDVIKAAKLAQKKRKRLPTRRLIKHVLRTRVKAAQALEALLSSIGQDETRINARPWLAQAAEFGGDFDEETVHIGNSVHGKEAVDEEPMGTRAGAEVVQFLRKSGAKIVPGNHDLDVWAGAQSEYEGVKSDDE